MDLLGRPLVILLAGLAVGLPVATYLLWSRVRGPRALRAASRVALLGLSQVTAVLLVAALLNDYGYFYGSWSELLGGSTSDGRVVHARVRGTGRSPRARPSRSPRARRGTASPRCRASRPRRHSGRPRGAWSR